MTDATIRDAVVLERSQPIVLAQPNPPVLEELLPLTEEAIRTNGHGTMPLPDVLERGYSEPFRYCLNTSTLRGFKKSLPELVDIAAGAGYEAIEPWIEEIERFRDGGGDLRDLDMRIRDLGLTVEGAIGFFEWAVDDDATRRAGLERARRDMGLLARIGGKRIAAPPWGAHAANAAPLSLSTCAERYYQLLRIGSEMGVTPMVEVWGFSSNLNRLGDAAYIAVESGHSDACILADVYHLYKGGSPISGLRHLGADSMRLFHVNDYPDITPETIKDSDRVYPGDGIAPLGHILATLRDIGFRGALSLELFNESYWTTEYEPLTIAKTGLEKLRVCVQRSFE